MGELSSLGVVIIAAVLVLSVFAVFRIPVKLLLRLAINTVAGFIALFVINFAGGFIGLSIPINWINAVIVGVFGLSGAALVLLLQWLALF